MRTRKQTKSLKKTRLSKFSYYRSKRINSILFQLGLERGRANAKKVFQVLKSWQEKKLILAYQENDKWGYYDYILHQDGWFMTLDAGRVNFQIKSSFPAAQEHSKEHPNIPVIVVEPGVSLEELGEKMEDLFESKLPQG